MTPYETPIRPRNQTTKRARNDEQDEEVPGKRHAAARLPSNATLYMLDAGGMPSPMPTSANGSDPPMQMSEAST